MIAFPLKSIISKPDVSGRLAKYAAKLNEFGLSFEPRMVIKSQVLADFIADFSFDEMLSVERELFEVSNSNMEWLTLFVNGSNKSKGSGVGIMLISPNRDRIKRAILCEVKTTNNKAEYKALIVGLALATELKIKIITGKSDSQLVIGQFKCTFQTKEGWLEAYLNLVKGTSTQFDTLKVEYVNREDNRQANALTNLESSLEATSVRMIPLTYAQWSAT